MAELKSCPFCGSDRIEVRYIYFRPYVICEKCHAQTPCYNTYPKALEAWNRRVNDNEIITLEYPCTNCNMGWGTASERGYTSCAENCELLKQYNKSKIEENDNG